MLACFVRRPGLLTRAARPQAANATDRVPTGKTRKNATARRGRRRGGEPQRRLRTRTSNHLYATNEEEGLGSDFTMPPLPWERGSSAAAAAAASTPSTNHATTAPCCQPPPATASAATSSSPAPAAGTSSLDGVTQYQNQHQPYGSNAYGASSYGGYGSSRYGSGYGGGYGSSSYGGFGGYGGYGSYGGGYGGYGGGMYGRGGLGGFGMYGGGPFGVPGDPDKDSMPPGLRQLESLLFSIGRITQMLEMNFDVLQHFLGSMISLFERLRHMYRDAATLTSTVSRQSLEFGQSSLSTVRDVRSRVRRHPLASLGLLSLGMTILLRALRSLARRRRLHRASGAAGLGNAFAAVASLDTAWQ